METRKFYSKNREGEGSDDDEDEHFHVDDEEILIEGGGTTGNVSNIFTKKNPYKK